MSFVVTKKVLPQQQQPKESQSPTSHQGSPQKQQQQQQQEGATSGSNSQVEILDPESPDFYEEETSSSGWKYGASKILRKTSGMLQRLSTLLLKIVKTIFPWNRRAKRRLAGGEDEEE